MHLRFMDAHALYVGDQMSPWTNALLADSSLRKQPQDLTNPVTRWLALTTTDFPQEQEQFQ
jgi:hypothetical protein